jgi:DNA-binding transcriptional ArsR family regulator
VRDGVLPRDTVPAPPLRNEEKYDCLIYPSVSISIQTDFLLTKGVDMQTGVIYHPRGVFYNGTGAYLTARLPVSLAARAVLAALAEHSGTKPYVWPSIGELADKLGIAARTVSSALRELTSSHLIRPIGRIIRRVVYVFLWHSALEPLRIRKVSIRTFTDEQIRNDLQNAAARRHPGHRSHEEHTHTPPTTRTDNPANMEKSSNDSRQNLQTSPPSVLNTSSLNPESCMSTELRQSCTGFQRQKATTGLKPLGVAIKNTLKTTKDFNPFDETIRNIERMAITMGYQPLSDKQMAKISEKLRCASVPEIVLAHCLEALEVGRRRGINPIAILWSRLFSIQLTPADTTLKAAKRLLFEYRVA